MPKVCASYAGTLPHTRTLNTPGCTVHNGQSTLQNSATVASILRTMRTNRWTHACLCGALALTALFILTSTTQMPNYDTFRLTDHSCKLCTMTHLILTNSQHQQNEPSKPLSAQRGQLAGFERVDTSTNIHPQYSLRPKNTCCASAVRAQMLQRDYAESANSITECICGDTDTYAAHTVHGHRNGHIAGRRTPGQLC
jgi:hypothetical protein